MKQAGVVADWSAEPVTPSFDWCESAPDAACLALGDRVVQALLAYLATGTDRFGLSR